VFHDVYISGQGFLNLERDGPFAVGGSCMPDDNVNTLAVFWACLDVTKGGVRYYGDGSRFVVSWLSMRGACVGGPFTFQAILYPSGEIRYQLSLPSLFENRIP
jgi:hypothetical protein